MLAYERRNESRRMQSEIDRLGASLAERNEKDFSILEARFAERYEKKLDAQFGELAGEQRTDEVVYEHMRDDAKVEQLGEKNEEVGGFLAACVVFLRPWFASVP